MAVMRADRVQSQCLLLLDHLYAPPGGDGTAVHAVERLYLADDLSEINLDNRGFTECGCLKTHE
jgi:hypothetical protein